MQPSSPPCPRCQKEPALCVCEWIQPIPTTVGVLILQHPQEIAEPLGTAQLAHLALPSSKLQVGLSWPNLTAAWGEREDPRRWIVLYAGSAKSRKQIQQARRTVVLVDRHGAPLPEAKQGLEGIRGLVVLDGSWRQVKSLWWRNAWLLKLQRAVLAPPAPSLYGKLRREPRRDYLSTLETIALCLEELQEGPEASQRLLAPFKKLLQAYGAPSRAKSAGPIAT